MRPTTFGLTSAFHRHRTASLWRVPHLSWRMDAFFFWVPTRLRWILPICFGKPIVLRRLSSTHRGPSTAYGTTTIHEFLDGFHHT